MRRNFTLIEILVSLVIIALMVGMTVGVVSSVGSQKEVDAATRMLTRMLELARGHAISNRTRTAVLLPTKSALPGTSQLKRESGFLLDGEGVYFAACTVKSNGSLRDYVKGGDWQRIPNRARFEHSIALKVEDVELRNLSGGTVADDLPAITFKPDGTLTASSEQRIYIATADPDGAVKLEYTIVVSPLTGAIKVLKGKR